MKTLTSSLLSTLLSAFLLFSWDRPAPTNDAFLDCLLSYDTMSEVVYTPQNASYESILQSTSQNLLPPSERPLKPIAIVLPENDEYQIQVTIICSKKYDKLIRVRVGGHDYEGLSYTSTTPFVIIDLRNLSSVTVDTESKTAWIQAGANLGKFYYAIAQQSSTLAGVAGDAPTVGAGGFFSGGGTSMLSRKFGLGVDNLIDARIIDVKGQILDRQSMGDDLFWAIKGAGSAGFGVITAYKVNLQTVPEKVTIFNISRTLEQGATQLIHRWQYIAANADENLMLRVFITSVTSDQTGKRTILASFTSMYLGGIDALLEILQNIFPELGLVKEDCTEMRWIETILYFQQYPPDTPLEVLLDRTWSGKSYFKGKSDYVTVPISENALEGLWERLHEEDETVSQLLFNPYGGKIAEIPETETPFPHRAGNIYLLSYYAMWENKDDSERHMSWIRNLYSYMAPYVSDTPRSAYYNYRDLDLGQNNIGNTSYTQARIWGKKYFGKNFDKLVMVKTKVDPGNFFRNEQSIPSLLAPPRLIQPIASA